ncbi:MAG: lytic transglycosylase domain-containing protein [Acidobacteriia bacterium]|nr:lytic transglycosylase domain-containing protein [Terriglobia bacterium]
MVWILVFVMFAGETPPPADKLSAVMNVSVERQLSAVRKQVSMGQATGSFFILPPPAPLSPPARRADLTDCPALSEPDLQPLLEEAARANGLKTDALGAIVRQKSGARPCAVSPSGAQGLMQLMPQTLEALGVTDAFDPRQNLAAGARLLKQLLDANHGDWDRAIAAYDGQPAAVPAGSSAAQTPAPPAQIAPAPADKNP